MPDLFAGLTVAIVALPLAMAFAIASGVEPQRGLYTAIVAGILVSLFGGSRVQIGGPTGAFVVIIYDIVMRHGYEGLALATLMAGFFLILMGFFSLWGDHQIYSLSRHHGFHFRDCAHHLHFADQGFFGIAPRGVAE